ncbi:TonB family protein [Mucilaginibacter paludis DSM 18603]|uniref:TonB family protein n=2 Tax=Mucilaginibacter TaxID=423349 RepID=H1Y9W5_9SPHI|nr:TonB family protein [Mucilaginibacter paludis DSM 18603]
MNKYLLILLITTLPYTLRAQRVTVTKIPENKINNKALDVEPKFPGGAKAFYKYISKNIAYDKDAEAKDMQGIVTISMAIEKDGRITDVKVVKGVSDIVDKEVVRVISSSPMWKPGMQHGAPIKVRYTFKIALTAS